MDGVNSNSRCIIKIKKKYSRFHTPTYQLMINRQSSPSLYSKGPVFAQTCLFFDAAVAEWQLLNVADN